MANFGKLDFNISLKPTSAFPLDARCYFESKSDADAAAATAEEAGSTNTIYYYGQKLVVVENGTATWYTIQPDKTLKKDGSGDDNTNSGDMLKSEYDTNGDGKVNSADDADKLGGQLPSHYAKASDLQSYVPTSKVGAKSGVASLDSTGKLPTTQLPTHAHEDLSQALEDAVEDMTEIANGKCASYVFENVDALDADIAEYVAFLKNGTELPEDNEFKGATLKTGDVFLIRAINVPDYWWDGTTDPPSKQVLETTKVNLSTISTTEIDAIVGS